MQTISRFRFPYLALAVAGCVAAWALQKMMHELSQTLESAGAAPTNGFAIILRYGCLLYLIPIALTGAHFISSKVSPLRRPLIMELAASAMILIYISTSFLLMTPFYPFHVEVKRASTAR